MTTAEFEARVVAWATTLPDLEALVQIGSRVQPGALVDEWSDWDYQLIVRDPTRYQNRDWPAQIAPCWSAHLERTEREVLKLSAVFAGGWEVDFVLLSAWQMKLVCWAMQRPGAQAYYPATLRRGIRNLQLVARPGCKVVLGGAAWEKRYAAMTMDWPTVQLSAQDFEFHIAAFWRHAVWVGKKTLRGEVRAALRWSQVEQMKHVTVLLEEEARLAGRSPRPELRQAERWLEPRRLVQTATALGADKQVLSRAQLEVLTLFEEVSGVVATQRGFPLPDYSAVAAWLRAELTKLTG